MHVSLFQVTAPCWLLYDCLPFLSSNDPLISVGEGPRFGHRKTMKKYCSIDGAHEILSFDIINMFSHLQDKKPTDTQ